MIDLRAYVGLPFSEVHCWGLVCRVYADTLGIILPTYGDVAAHDLIRVSREMKKGKAAEVWSAVSEPAELDVVLMRSPRGGRAVVHVGVAVDRTRLLHVEDASAAVVVPMAHVSVAGRIVGFRRYAS